MEIKKGQWARTKYGFGKLINVDEYGNYLFERFNTTSFVCQKDNIIAVADTPQELVQVGDLVFMDSMDYPRCFIVSSGSLPNYDLQYITKILTPNAQGGFDLQWEL